MPRTYHIRSISLSDEAVKVYDALGSNKSKKVSSIILEWNRLNALVKLDSNHTSQYRTNYVHEYSIHLARKNCKIKPVPSDYGLHPFKQSHVVEGVCNPHIEPTCFECWGTLHLHEVKERLNELCRIGDEEE